MRKSKRVDPESLNDLIDELSTEAGSDHEQNIEFPAGIAEEYLAAMRWFRDR